MIESVFIILNWHTPELTQKLLYTIPHSDNNYIIIINQEVTSLTSPTFGVINGMLIDLPTNIGVPKGYNEGIKEALKQNPRYIFILNSDVELLPGCIERMIACAESDPKIGIVGAKALRYGENPAHPDHFGIVIFKQGDIIGKQIQVPYGAPDLNINIENFCVGFACALLKTDMIKEIGLFDEAYSPCDYEDTDYCFIARSKGWKVMSCTSARYFHLEGATIKKHNFRFNYDKNRQYFANKWKDML